MPEFFFRRYVNGERMADDVLITKQPTLEAAIPEALRLCRNSPKSVLVYVPPEDNALREEITRLREQNTELVLRGYALLSLLSPETTCGEMQKARAALRAAAILEGGRMGDILERLQGPRTPQGGSWPYPNLHDEAADEITILRGQVEALDNERNRLWTEKLRMQLEITRLKELVQDAYYKGWQDSASREYSRQEIQKDWETSEVFSALNGEKK